MLPSCSAIVLLLSLFSVRLFAQTPDTAMLQGTVADATQAAISGANIVLTNELTGLVRTTQSDGLGRFSLGVCQSPGNTA